MQVYFMADLKKNNEAIVQQLEAPSSTAVALPSRASIPQLKASNADLDDEIDNTNEIINELEMEKSSSHQKSSNTQRGLTMSQRASFSSSKKFSDVMKKSREAKKELNRTLKSGSNVLMSSTTGLRSKVQSAAPYALSL